jgi:hypothetical protein
VSAPPLIVLGVRRSGTTLLRVMLDRSSQLAVPDESYFLPQLANRHGDRPDLDEFQDALRRLPTLREWELNPEDVRGRLRPGMTLGEAVGAVYETYAAQRGKTRWGDKTPMYMQYLPLLERLFPDARYVHLIRDGRDAALSFLQMPEGVVTKTWAHPRDAAGFACQWRTEVAAARALGRRAGASRYLELRYERLVEDPEHELRRTCTFAELPFEPKMLAYAGNVDVSRKPHQRSLKRPPTPGLRDWRNAMSPDDVAAFQEIAADVLANLGYPLADDAPPEPTTRGRRRLASYRALTAAWRASAYAMQRSPLWRRRHPPLT